MHMLTTSVPSESNLDSIETETPNNMDTFEHEPLVAMGATYLIFPLLILFKIVEKRSGVNGSFCRKALT